MSFNEINYYIDEITFLIHHLALTIIAFGLLLYPIREIITIIKNINKDSNWQQINKVSESEQPASQKVSGGASVIKFDVGKIYGQFKKYPTWKKFLIVACIFLASGIFGTRAFTQSKFQNEILTEASWISFDKGQYEEAIKKAEKCIKEFGDDAIEKQQKLTNNNIPLPPEGEDSVNISKERREEIFKRGVLNDVAACWFIKAKSLEELNKNEDAKKAYQATAQFTYARVWDPKWKGFWSPSKKAQSILNRLQ